MNTLVLNGSPRKKGDTVALVAEMQKYLAGEVDIVSAYHDGIEGCIDCRYCWKNEGCVIDDPMQRVFSEMDSYNNVIIASPLYFAELTGALLNVVSRFQHYYAARVFRGMNTVTTKKNGVLVLAGGGDYHMSRAQATAKIVFGQINTTCVGEVLSLDTNTVAARDDRTALDKAKEMAILLNALYK